MTVKVRFAPSPTGKLHVGNVRAALINWLFAKKSGGTFLLRSDDTDQARSTKAFEQGIETDLAWLGITHDEFMRQSERFGAYDKVADWMKAQGLLYPCYETPDDLDRKRKLQRARSLPPVYDRAALDLSDAEKSAFEAEGRKAHWRFKLSHQPVSWLDLIRGDVTVETRAVSDPVLIREDGQYLYTLPSCVDDIDYAITHVVRGEDHVTNTATQLEIFKEIIRFRGAGALPSFAHTSLLVGADGQGLSKRLGSLSIESFREQGLEAASITSLLARLGTSLPVVPEANIKALVAGFAFETMGRAPAKFDPVELETLNAKILHDLDWDTVANRLKSTGCTENIWQLIKGNISRLSDVDEWVQVITGRVNPDIEDRDFTDKAAKLVPDSLDATSWGALTSALKEATGAKGKALFMPLRKALTGKSHGPDMAGLFPLIGAEKAKARLRGETA